MALKNKRILITAGPTWVRLDRVRILTNIATGKTGVLLAKKLVKLGNKVTLLLGPVSQVLLDKKINLKRFCFFDEFKKIFISELKNSKYDIIIHSAGVADFKPLRVYNCKLSSKKNWRIILIPTEKIINEIKRILPDAFLVGFKLESFSNRDKLIESAHKLMKQAKADLVVANWLNKDKYIAYIVEKENIKGPFLNKKELTGRLIERLKKIF